MFQEETWLRTFPNRERKTLPKETSVVDPTSIQSTLHQISVVNMLTLTPHLRHQQPLFLPQPGLPWTLFVLLDGLTFWEVSVRMGMSLWSISKSEPSQLQPRSWRQSGQNGLCHMGSLNLLGAYSCSSITTFVFHLSSLLCSGGLWSENLCPPTIHMLNWTLERGSAYEGSMGGISAHIKAV